MLIDHVSRSVRKRIAGFIANERGNVAILFGASLIPLIGLVGLATDYGVALTDKTKLDNAADDAAIAAVSTAIAYVSANPSDSNVTNDAITAGLAQASSGFTVNTGNLPFAQPPTVVTIASTPPSPSNCAATTACIYLSRTNMTFSSTVVYTTATQNHFGQIFGYPTMNVAGTAVASATLPSYLDFYLLVDVSGSMGLPVTAAGQSTLMSQFSCQFACHFPGQTSAYNYANTNSIQLRAGAVNAAVCGLLVQASTPQVTHEYRVGLYPYITQMGTLSALTYADPAPTPSTPSSNAVWNAAGCIPNSNTPFYTTSNPPVFTSLLDTGTTQLYTGNDPTTGVGSGGTHFQTIFGAIQSTISKGPGFGNGSSSSTSRPFVFLITDGMQNSQYYDSYYNNSIAYPGNPSSFKGYSNANFTGSSPQAMNPSQCAALKAAGATVSVLYIPYQQLTIGNQNQGETSAADNAIPNLPNALQTCATSPAFFYTANSQTDITNALAYMFKQANQVAHLQQ